MPYLTSTSEIQSLIREISQKQILWIDTEVANFQTKNPQLSLIQVLDEPEDMSGDRAFILDVLDNPQGREIFIREIMVNPSIEKVFHNANYDLKFLGGKQGVNITCTLELAKKIPYYLLPVANYQLKTLATHLCEFFQIDKQEQSSDWGKRPLSDEQIEYALLDCIYLAQIHKKLLTITAQIHPEPHTENIDVLTARYQQLEHEYNLINSEYEHLKERIKQAMQAQNIFQTPDFKLKKSHRTTLKVSISDLANFIKSQEIKFDFPLTLTQKMQQELGENIDQLPIEKSTSDVWALTKNHQDNQDI
ncbi:3'-5' exonuclease [Calothrix sp. 336/3]|uniref:3'-5' exonuclease n=1 Tax=Calothrix sp. 336/3 TaxID=1337936 RepID=UPI0004E2C9B7|nr:3'-5' exonuclease [Calothrix sp. 336/3]AKG24507.1 3'-5' exonuclease [Calothrix sp. 336/3]